MCLCCPRDHSPEVPESRAVRAAFSVERRKLMRMLGAKVIVTPKAGKGTGMVRKAEELCEKHGWFLCHQFENEANWKFHEETTGPEVGAPLRTWDPIPYGHGTPPSRGQVPPASSHRC